MVSEQLEKRRRSEDGSRKVGGQKGKWENGGIVRISNIELSSRSDSEAVPLSGKFRMMKVRHVVSREWEKGRVVKISNVELSSRSDSEAVPLSGKL